MPPPPPIPKKIDPVPVTTPGIGVEGPALAFFDTPTDIIGSGNLQWDNINYILALNGSLKLAGGFLVAGDILYADATPKLNRLPKGTDSYVLTIDPVTHLPSWKAATGGVTDHALLTDLDWLHAGHTINADVNFATYKAVAMACDNGATVPTSPTPVVGQWFLHAPTGRKVLLQYDGSNWQPIISYGAMAMYVDHTNGTDDVNHGTGTGASAFKTVTYAVSIIPSVYQGNVTITATAEAYSELPIIQGKNPSGNYSITINGTMTQTLGDTTASGGSQGAAGVQATVTVSGTPWTAHAYQNLLLWFDATTTTVALQNVRLIIDDNTNNTLTLVGWLPATPAATDTFKIFSWGTTLAGLQLNNGQKGVLCQYIDFTEPAAATATAYALNYSVLSLYYCTIQRTDTAAHIALRVNEFSEVSAYYCMINAPSAYPIYNGNKSHLILNSTKVYGGSGQYAFRNINQSLSQVTDCVIDGNSQGAVYGVTGEEQSQVYFAYTSNYKNFIRNCATGLYLMHLSMTGQIASVTYSGNTANQSVDATSFCYAG